MDAIRERQLASLFYRFGSDASANVRARLVHYAPWKKDALGNEASFGNDQIAEKLTESTGRSIVNSSTAAATLVSRHGSPALKALRRLGVSRANIGRLTRAARGMRKISRGLAAIGDVYDQMAMLGAFNYSDGLIVRRAERRLHLRSTREGYEEFAVFVPKVRPFFDTIEEFITLMALSIEAMPTTDVDVYAIEAAFNAQDIPIPPELRALFYGETAIEEAVQTPEDEDSIDALDELFEQ